MSHREQKEELFAHTAAEFVNRESNRESLVTVTRTELSHDEKNVTVFITVLPENQEVAAFAFLKRKRGELRTFAQKKTRTRVLPFFDFAIDFGEKNRQELDTLS
jgi:ribosome-binding factor A